MGHQDALERDTKVKEAAEATPPQAVRGGAQAWNAVLLDALATARVDLPTATRALAIVHGCMYNAWAACDDVARQTVHGMAVRLPRPQRGSAAKRAAMDQAARLALTGLFPWRQADFDTLPAWPSRAALPDPLSPAGIGRLQALAALDAWRGGMTPFAPAVMAMEHQGTPAARLAPASISLLLDCCGRARVMADRDGYTEDRQVLLYFVLAHALADAAIAAAGSGVLMEDVCAAAAGLVLRRFGAATERVDGLDAAACGMGNKVGALVFERARRYWQGIL